MQMHEWAAAVQPAGTYTKRHARRNMGPPSSHPAAAASVAGKKEKRGMEKSATLSDNLIAGAFAGFVARLVTAPFDLVKIRFQLQQKVGDSMKYTSMRQAFTSIVKEEGLSSLWKGNVSATYLWISYAMIQFSVYGILKSLGQSISNPFENNDCNNITGINKRKVQQNNSNNHNRFWNTFVLFLAGSGAGMTATALTYPFDIMRTQFAVQGNTRSFVTMRSFITHTLAHKGVRGFYAGSVPAIVGITPYMGLNFAIYESMLKVVEKFQTLENDKNRNKNNDKKISALKGIMSNGLCGAVAGGASKFLVFPLDTVKKRMQVQVLSSTLEGASSFPRYRGVWDCIATTMRTEGLRGFYRGIVPTTVKSVIATAVTFAAYESAKDYLGEMNKEERD